MGEKNLPDIRRGDVGPQIDYIDVFAQDVTPRKPWWTKWQVFVIGLALGFFFAVAAMMYGLDMPGANRPIPPGGLPVSPVHSTQ